ncbi:MAG: hypothetical protein AAF572_20925 [Cyanobacteria bacterium P01_B01_bin.77]
MRTPLDKVQINNFKRRFKADFKTQEANLDIPAEARISLENAATDIQRIEESRENLANFIKQTFPLDSILK